MNVSELPENHFYFTSESVTEGHPDKICDSISDSILDACLEQDPYSRVACECVTKSNMVMVFGEITTTAKINFEHIVRERLKEIGYDDYKKGINYKDCDVIIKIAKQSPEINEAVSGKDKKEEEIGAGDQGLMFGYATNESQEMMPFSHLMALKLSDKLTEVRKKGILPWLYPDGKTQVTVEYKIENGETKPVHIHTVLISCQHSPEIELEEIASQIKTNVIYEILPKEYLDEKTRILVNPSGKFVIGGPEGDAGLTGRKIIVDTYGGWGAHGGGAFSGKDCTKVDRSGAYMARYIAKSLVYSGLCKRCLVQISYSIGVAKPMSIYVNSYGTVLQGKTDEILAKIIEQNFDLRPGMIIKNLKLRSPIFKKTSVGGHFGRDIPEFSWETPLKINY